MTTPPAIIETKVFTRIWDHFGLQIDDLLAMQNECFDQLKSAPVIPGCGGARKMRFSPNSNAGGKRGAMRVLFKYFGNYRIVIMILVYPKNAKENITADEKRVVANAIKTIDEELAKRFKENFR